MQINQAFLEYIEPYLIKLREKIGDFVVFGSAPLYLYGVVEFNGQINDLDVYVEDEKMIPSDAQKVTFHKDNQQNLYKIIIDDLDVDIGGYWPGYGGILTRINSGPYIINSFKFANLDIVEEWKKEMVRKYDRQKDKDYLEKIKEWRHKRNI
ncbi:MAG: hypothetical protein ACOYMB_01580 [Patescibacteria group bacterium]